MNCDICFEPFDHSIHKPYNLSCPHTYCLECIQKLRDNKCPQCKQIIKEKYPCNILLRLIPESNYDKLKSKSLKTLIELNEIKQDMNTKCQVKLTENEMKLKSTKQHISDETNKAIMILKENEAFLINICDSVQNRSYALMDSNKYVFNMNDIIVAKERIEKNELNENQLSSLNDFLNEIKQKYTQNLYVLTNQINKVDKNVAFILNKILNDILYLGEIKVIFLEILLSNYFIL